VAFLRSFWGSIVMLLLVLIVLERAVGVSRILAASGGFVGTTVKAFTSAP
jgi:hypothetical protein